MCEKDNVIFKTFIKQNNNNILFKEYTISLKFKIIDIKNLIIKNLIDNNLFDNNKFNYVDLENITDKIYKDFGKLYFDKGILPMTYDNYILSDFTGDNRIFEFIIIPTNIKQNIQVNKPSGILKKVINEEKKKNNEFTLDTDDFPPLGTSSKITKKI
jgi:hypothetical protein